MAANDRVLQWWGIRIPSARNHCPAFDKDKYLEPMFGDVSQARTNAAMLLMMIATTSSRTCTKPTVSGSFDMRLQRILLALSLLFGLKKFLLLTQYVFLGRSAKVQECILHKSRKSHHVLVIW